MPHYVRMMRKEDVALVTDIDREAFSTQWPPPNYQHELQNRLARHIVACDDEKLVEHPEVKARTKKNSTGLASIMRRLFNHNHFFNNELPPSRRHYVTGFAGFWVMADEAHITAIAVREAYRQQGIGELLLISVIGLATELNARIVTLELRASNAVAQSLYAKYGFTQVGTRHAYYIDNREDAIVMSTQDITLASFQKHLQQLKQTHSRKCGIALYQIVR